MAIVNNWARVSIETAVGQVITKAIQENVIAN